MSDEVSYREHQVRQIDILRLLLEHEPEHFETISRGCNAYTNRLSRAIDAIEWLWDNVTFVLQNEGLLEFRSHILRVLVENLHALKYYTDDERMIEGTVRLLNTKMKEHYSSGIVGLVKPLFFQSLSSTESQEIGSVFIDLLSRSGFDVQACIRADLDHFSHVMKDSYGISGLCRKVILEPYDRGGWSLRWEWILDSSSPGYLLVSEHIGLGPDTIWLDEWPFGQGKHYLPWDGDGDEYWNQKSLRAFERRMNNKAGKARKKERRKQRHKVPGAWI